MRRLFLGFAAVVAIGVGWAFAQNVQQTLVGTESWVVGQSVPGGPGVFTNTNGMRGMTNAILPAQTTITTTVSPGVNLVVASGAITTLNLSLPAAPFDGQTIEIACPGGTITTLTLSVGVATSASVISGAGNAAGGSATASTCSNALPASMFSTYTASANAASLGGGVTWNRIR